MLEAFLERMAGGRRNQMLALIYRKSFFVLLSLFAMVLSSCSLLDDRSYSPAYLVIEKVEMRTTPAQGYPSHKITDVWVYADEQLLGVFPLPARIPVIVDDGKEVKFEIFAGIRNNGIKGFPVIQNLIGRNTFTLTMSPLEEVKKDIAFYYSENAQFAIVEDFESTNKLSADLDDDPETKVVRSSDDARYGNYCGHVHLTSDHHTLNVSFENPFSGATLAHSHAFLELDYKNSVPFAVSIIRKDGGRADSKNLILLKESEDWNKIYIDLSDVLNSVSLETYNIIISSKLEGKKSGDIYLDNLKIVHL